jgi:DNA-binding SARP family transcriptional activator
MDVARLVLRLLGGFDASLEAPGSAVALPTRKVQALLAYLALSPGQRHPRDKLTSLLWGELRAGQARNNLRQALFALRRALTPVAPGPLRLEADTVALEAAAVDVDALRFEQRLARGSPAALEGAVELYRGDLLAGLRVQSEPFEEWLLAERERLRELALEALARLLAHRQRAGEHEAAVQTALRLLTLDPLQEPVHRTLMRLYARLGRRGAALRQYQACVDVLRKELGLEPEPRTRRLYRLILRRAAPEGTRSYVVDHGILAPGVLPAGLPLVGRAAELAGLHAALGAARNGTGGLVAVLGDAGIGKTRLLTELVADATRQGFQVLVGRAHESERILPFGPWLDALQGTSRATEPDGLPATWQPELWALFPDLAPGRAAPGTSERDARRLFEGMTRLLERLAQPKPLLCVLEDLHWADDMSLRLLAVASRGLRDRRALIAWSARTDDPEEGRGVEQALDELGHDGRLVTIRLTPLSRDATFSIAHALTGARVDPTDRDRLAEHAWVASEGNPFVAVETLRALVADGGDPSDVLAPPEGVQALVRRRLERLSARGRHLVTVAAVIGREFDFTLLAEASGLGVRDAAGGVEELVRRGLLLAVGEQLEFPHDWLRRVALGEILPPIRRMLHRGVAEALETVHAGRLTPHVLAIGLHFEEAGVWARAVSYLRQAGTQALGRAGYREAALAFERALRALGNLSEGLQASAEAVDLRRELNDALVPLGEYRSALDHLREAERLALALGDQARLARVLSEMCARLRNVGEHDGAVATGRRAAGLAASLGDQELEAAIAFRLGQAHLGVGEFQEAARLLRHALDLEHGGASGDRSRKGRVMTRVWLARALTGLGAFEEALIHGEEAVRQSVARGDPYALTMAQAFLGHLMVTRRDLTRAIPLLGETVRIARAADIPDTLSSAIGALGQALVLAGRVPEGVPLLEQVVVDDLRRGVAHAFCMLRLAEGYLRAGRLDEALERATRALELARTHGERAGEAWATWLVGEIRCAAVPSDPARAEAHYRGALTLAQELGMRPLVARCHVSLGRLGRRQRPEEAEAHLATATRLCTEMGLVRWLSEDGETDPATRARATDEPAGRPPPLDGS